MRILIVTPLIPPEPGGPSYYSVGLKEALEHAGHTVDLIAFREVRRYASGVRHIIFFYKVLFRALSADALIVLDTVSVALPAVIAGWVLGKKTIVRIGGDFVWEAYVERTKEKVKLSAFYTAPRALTKKERVLIWVQKHVVLRLATKIVFSTAWQRDLWLVPYCVPDIKASVVENICTSEVMRNVDSASSLIFLWVGRDLVLKNVDTLKSAFEHVKKRYPAMELELLSGVPHEDVLDAIESARCLVVPSLSEVSPNIVYEALVHGVPVICTDDTGIRDTAPGGVVFVDVSDEGALTQALLDMCDASTYARARVGAGTPLPVRTYDTLAQEFLGILSQGAE